MRNQSPLLAFQGALGRHVRDPRRAPRPDGVTARRMGIYSELVFNNLEGLLRPCFPVTRAVLGPRWSRLVRQFCREGRCETPLFREVPGEFVQWLMATPDTDVPVPPWLRALAHYEWAELAVELMPRDDGLQWVASPQPPAESDAPEAWHDQIPALNPAHMSLQYPWPVHRIGPAFRPRKPLPTFVLVHRDRADEVCFTVLNAVSSRLLHHASSGVMSAREACEAVAAELGQAGAAPLIDQGLAQLRQWRAQDVIVENAHAND